MNSILYSVKIGGKNTDIFNIKKLLDGINLNSFFDNYEIHFFVEENIEKDLYAFLKKIEQSKHLKIFYYNTLSWYNWLKYSFQNSLNFDYLITCHDDVYIQTKNFDKVFIEQLSSVENIGTFSFIDSGYKRRFFNPQLRGAYHIDRVYSNSRALGIEYEYHNQKKNWHFMITKSPVLP